MKTLSDYGLGCFDRTLCETEKPVRTNKQQPATAYDYRRVIALVQVLALSEYPNIEPLCKTWGVAPVMIESRIPGEQVIDIAATIQRLAQAALEAAREERD